MNRRSFIQLSTLAGGGLLLHFSGLAASAPAKEAWKVPDTAFALNAFLRITPDNAIRVYVSRHEMGQGVASGLAQILAEELDVAWEGVQLEFGESDLNVFGAKGMGGHGTGGSTTILSMWKIMRTMGASARWMLRQAAANRWRIALEGVETEAGTLRNMISGEKLTYGEMAAEASRLPVPEGIEWKSGNFRLIGQPLTNKITADVVQGRHPYGLDVDVPGMLYALIVRCPVFGGTLQRVDAQQALDVKGVKKIISTKKIAGVAGGMPFHVREGVAVLADSYWAARKGAEKLRVTWSEGEKGNRSLSDLEAWMQAELDRESQPTAYLGEPDAFANVNDVKRTIGAEYRYPYQLHAPMEVLNCTAHVRGERCEIWIGTQSPEYIAREAQRLFGLDREKMLFHLLPSGGGFGRRYYPDVALEAIHLSKEAGGIPVKLLYTREQDFTQNMVHPYSMARYQVGLNRDNALRAWYVKELRTYTWGAKFPYQPELPWIGYGIPNVRFDFRHLEKESLLQSCAWRAVLANAWAFGQECFLDEIAHQLQKDPLLLRRELLKGDADIDIGHSYPISPKRLRGVMELAAEKASWTTPRPKGKGIGLAVYPYMHGNSYCAQVAEVSVTPNGFSVDKVVCAVDCGRVVNPELVKNQIEGGIVWGLSALLYGGVELKRGRVQRTNFHQNRIVRNLECPDIEVHFVPSEEGPYGVGELSPPPAVPAVMNALFNATGKRIRQIPVQLEMLL